MPPRPGREIAHPIVMTTRRLAIVVLVASIPVTAAADGHIEGRVMDPAGDPVAGATVVVGDQTVTSGRAGQFTLKQVPPGKVQLVTVFGAARTLRDVAVHDGRVTHVDITLDAKRPAEVITTSGSTPGIQNALSRGTTAAWTSARTAVRHG